MFTVTPEWCMCVHRKVIRHYDVLIVSIILYEIQSKHVDTIKVKLQRTHGPLKYSLTRTVQTYPSTNSQETAPVRYKWRSDADESAEAVHRICIRTTVRAIQRILQVKTHTHTLCLCVSVFCTSSLYLSLSLTLSRTHTRIHTK
jgi:hypothetical protein